MDDQSGDGGGAQGLKKPQLSLDMAAVSRRLQEEQARQGQKDQPTPGQLTKEPESPSIISRLIEIFTPRSPLESALDAYNKQRTETLQYMAGVLARLDPYSFAAPKKQDDSQSIDVIAMLAQLKVLDGLYIQSLLKDRLEEILNELVAEGIIELVGDGEFLKKTIVPKSGQTGERLHHDTEEVLIVEELLTMTDLEFLFTINAYDLPYCKSTNHRSGYEIFYGELLKKALSIDEDFKKYTDNCKHIFKNYEAYCYYLLRECVARVHTHIEDCLAGVRCVLEIMKVIKIALTDSSSSTVEEGLYESPIEQEERFSKIVEWFGSDDAVFSTFSSTKIYVGVNDEIPHIEEKDGVRIKHKAQNSAGNKKWLFKAEKYGNALDEAVQIYEETWGYTDSDISKFANQHDTGLEKQTAGTSELCTSIRSFIKESRKLLKFLTAEQMAYKKMLDHGLTVLKLLAGMQTPVHYGRSANTTPRQSPRSSPYKGSQTSRAYLSTERASLSARRGSGDGRFWADPQTPQPQRIKRDDARLTRSAGPSPRKQPPGSPQRFADTSDSDSGYTTPTKTK